MKGSWKIGRVAGIDIYLHLTFVLLLAWVGVSHYLRRGRWDDAVNGLIFILALFTIVVLHELGHALTARHFGIRTRDIILLPIGGVARLEKIPEEPRQELWVALAGPAVNAVLALLFLAALALNRQLSALTDVAMVGGPFLAKLVWVNVSLAVFNLLPAFPMDGGRVLRALLALRMEYVRATQVAARIGKGMAWVFGFLGLFTNPFLVFVALFVWMGATQEAEMVEMKSALGGMPVGRLMIREFKRLSPDEPLANAVQQVLAGWQEDFPVCRDGQIVGILRRANLLSGLSSQGTTAPVAEAMNGEFGTARSDETVEAAFKRMQETQVKSLPVVDDGALVGMLTTENIAEFVMIREALGGAGQNGASDRGSAVFQKGGRNRMKSTPD